MKDKKTTIQRLSLIKYLYSLGINLCSKSEPLSGLSILFFHDSIELFLQLSAEKIGAAKSDINFMSYWKLFEDKDKQIPYKENMKKLNRARGSLKHHGLLPSKQDIDYFRVSASDFIEESTKLIFNINFNNISIIDYIDFEKTKKYLKLSEEKFEKGEKKKAEENLSLSFYYLLQDYEELKRSEFNYSPFSFGQSMNFFDIHGIDNFSKQLHDCIDSLSKSVEEIQNALRIISFGLDYIKYIKFDSKIPRVRFMLAGNHTFYFRNEKEISFEDFEFCRDFIIESAFKFQE